MYKNDIEYDEDRYITDCGLVGKNVEVDTESIENKIETTINIQVNENKILKTKEENKQNIRRFDKKDKNKAIRMIS